MLLCSLEALTQHLLLSQGSCHVYSCVFLQCRSHGFFFSVVLLYNAAAQLQECEKCKKPGSRLAVREGCTSPTVPPKQIWLLFSKYDHVLR